MPQICPLTIDVSPNIDCATMLQNNLALQGIQEELCTIEATVYPNIAGNTLSEKFQAINDALNSANTLRATADPTIVSNIEDFLTSNYVREVHNVTAGQRLIVLANPVRAGFDNFFKVFSQGKRLTLNTTGTDAVDTYSRITADNLNLAYNPTGFETILIEYFKA